MKKGVLVVVALLAIAGLMAAMAYNEATITSDQTLKVVATDQALLALKPGTGVGNLDETAYVDVNGVLQIEFGKGLGENGFHGLQPGSVYRWEKLISVQNKSAETLEVELTLDGGAAISEVRAFAEGSDNGNWFSGMLVWDNTVGAHAFTLGPNNTIDLAFEIEVPVGATMDEYVGTMVVKAVAQ